MDSPNWRQILGGAAGVALLGSIGYFGQARIRTGAAPQKISKSQTNSEKKSKAPEVVPDTSTDRETDSPPVEEKTSINLIKVDITGEIAKPGVYEIAEGLRVEELVKIAGGLKPTADRNKVNYALKLKDEAKIIVPAIVTKVSKASQPKSSRRDVEPVPISGTLDGSLDEGVRKVPPFVPPGSPRHRRSPVGSGRSSVGTDREPIRSIVAINSASEEDLHTIPGISMSLAKKISDYRSSVGAFSQIEDLKHVKGVSDRLFDKIRPWVTL